MTYAIRCVARLAFLSLLTGATGPSNAFVASVSPAGAIVAPGASQQFTAHPPRFGDCGRGLKPYWVVFPNGSGGTISATGLYTAGTTENVTDTVAAWLYVGSTGGCSYGSALVSVSVLNVAPAPVQQVEFGASQPFTVSGGSGTGYTWSFVTNVSGASVSAAGVYTAGAAAGSDVLKVVDSVGHAATFAVVVVPHGPLSISPSSLTLAPVESQAFNASGGSPPYTWAIATNLSGATLNGAGDAGIPEGPSVEYQAGATGDVADAVRLTDSLGFSVTTNVTVTAALSITPPGQVTLEAKTSHAFTASGGRGPYTWALATNASGGTVSESGEYTAGANGHVTDVVQATDSLGTSTTASVTVTSSGGCGATEGGTFPLLALLVLPLLASRRRTAGATAATP
jgi:Synergist-CTERM protein sorting domain-containing protein